MNNLPAHLLSLFKVWRRFALLQLILLFIFSVIGVIAVGENGIIGGIVIWMLILIYFLPLFVSLSRRHPSKWAIGALNLFLGWTLLGWVGALVWSLIELNKSV